MVGVMTNSIAEVMFGREEQMELYKDLDQIEKAKGAMVAIKVRRIRLSGKELTEREVERLCVKFGLIPT